LYAGTERFPIESSGGISPPADLLAPNLHCEHQTNVWPLCCRYSKRPWNEGRAWGGAMAIRLEHANVCVRDLQPMIQFLQTAFPEFRVRGEGTSNDGTRWVHVGTDDTYIALGQSRIEPQNGGRLMRVSPA
jgi:hypothetical protein